MSDSTTQIAVPRPSAVLVGIGAIAMVAALYGAFLYAPTDGFQGDAQRLFYLHVPAALTMYLAIFLVFIASLLYLQSRDARWDEVAAAGGDLGLFYGTMVMITGPIWAKPIWGVWWTWDARLTSFFILYLIFIGYVMLRTYGGTPDQVARFCAVLAILGFIGVPITHYSVEWWRTLHPQPVLMTEGGIGRGMPGSMLAAWSMGMVATVALYANLLVLRLRLERQSRRVQELRRRLDLQEIV